MMAEDDRRGNLRRLQRRREVHQSGQLRTDRVAGRTQSIGIVAYDVEDPERSGLAADRNAHFTVAAANQCDDRLDVFAQICRRESAALDKRRDEDAVADVLNPRPETRNLGRSARRGLSSSPDMMNRKVAPEPRDMGALVVRDLEARVAESAAQERDGGHTAPTR